MHNGNCEYECSLPLRLEDESGLQPTGRTDPVVEEDGLVVSRIRNLEFRRITNSRIHNQNPCGLNFRDALGPLLSENTLRQWMSRVWFGTNPELNQQVLSDRSEQSIKMHVLYFQGKLLTNIIVQFLIPPHRGKYSSEHI